MRARDSLTQPNHTLQLPNCDPEATPRTMPSRILTPQYPILLHQHIARLGCQSRRESPRVADISLQSLSGELGLQSGIAEAMDADDVARDGKIRTGFALV